MITDLLFAFFAFDHRWSKGRPPHVSPGRGKSTVESTTAQRGGDAEAPQLRGSGVWEQLKTTSSVLFLVVRMLLVAMPGAPSSVLAPSSKARSPY